MKHYLIMALCLVLSVTSVAFAAEKSTLPLVEGIVKKIDLPAGKVTLAHAAIPNLKMQPMTMPYRVKVVSELKALHEGDKVKFTADKLKEGYTVLHIEIVK
ncbi:MAG: copper-binding protein [Gallionella sp.]